MAGRADPLAPVDLQPWIKPAVLAFKRAELRFLDSLPARDKAALCGGAEGCGEYEQVKQGIRQYGKVAWTLAGLKPCVLIVHASLASYARGLALGCLAPVMRRFGLQQQGFVLCEIRHPMRTSTPGHPGFTGGWVLANTRHPDFWMVEQALLRPFRGPVPEDLIGAALGYPLPGGDATLEYTDASEAALAGEAPVVLEFFCPDVGGYQQLMEHFGRYHAVWQALGWDLNFETGRHEAFAAWLDCMRAELSAERRREQRWLERRRARLRAAD